MLTSRQKKLLVKLTSTNLPKYHDTPLNPKTNRKWRQNYPSGEIAHHWARNTIPEGRCGKLFFYDGIIWSYGRHFPIARHVKVKKTKLNIILFTTQDYSPSTAGHKSDVRRAIPGGAIVFFVPNVLADTRLDHRENLEWFREQAKEAYDKALTATRNAPYFLQDTLRHIHSGNRYAETVGLTDRIGSLLGGDLPSFEERVRREIDAARAKLEALDATAEERFKARNAAKMAAYEKELAEWEVELKEWFECTRKEFPEKPVKPGPGQRHYRWSDGTTYVRVLHGKYLHTSKGMLVPIAQVLPILAAIRNGPQTASRMDPPFPASEFKVSVNGSEWEGAIDWQFKVFTIGCHTVTFAEIERAAAAAGL